MEIVSQVNSYVKVIVQFAQDILPENKNILDQFMLEHLGCDGIEDLSLSENELNELLGQEAVTGGPLPREVLTVLDDYEKNMEHKSSTYYFYGEHCLHTAEQAVSYIQNTFEDQNVMAVEIKICEEEPWLEKWKEHYHPIEISKDLIVLPSWHEPTDFSHSHKLRIDPGQAFGTGSHESTKLCLSIIHQYFSKPSPIKILDFGCGSGILALAHTLLNNACVTSLYDIDPAAYDNIEINRELNHIPSHQVHLIPATAEFPLVEINKTYDLVMANILLPILIDKARLLTTLVAPQGYLLISGIMVDQWEELSSVLSEHALWELIDFKELNQWKAVLIKKSSL